MAMLAEPRRRVPRVNARASTTWSSDDNKFGQRLLEKMGWEKGRGLGAKMDGNTASLPLRVKLDSKGLGFSPKDDQWTSHETMFQGLLTDLNGGSAEHVSPTVSTSLEKKSKNIQSRIHYKKFTRGKDISQYSSKDLANIFGKKSLDRSAPEVVEEVKTDSAPVGVGGYNFVAAGSIGDYFSKLQGLKTSKAESEKEDYECDFAFRGFSDARYDDDVSKESADKSPENVDRSNGYDSIKFDKKIKKRKRKAEVENCLDEEVQSSRICFESNSELLVNNFHEQDVNKTETKRKKKKRAKQTELQVDKNSFVQFHSEQMQDDCGENETESKKNKKKNRKKESKCQIDVQNDVECHKSESQDNIDELLVKKKKKKKNEK